MGDASFSGAGDQNRAGASEHQPGKSWRGRGTCSFFEWFEFLSWAGGENWWVWPAGGGWKAGHEPAGGLEEGEAGREGGAVQLLRLRRAQLVHPVRALQVGELLSPGWQTLTGSKEGRARSGRCISLLGGEEDRRIRSHESFVGCGRGAGASVASGSPELLSLSCRLRYSR